MKSYGWTILIGIICIIFGITGLANNILQIFVTNMDGEVIAKIPDELKYQSKIIEYIGVLVYTFYLMAGVFFLMKKSFSLKMMNIALVISILFIIIPILILHQGASLEYFFDYRFTLSNFLSPALDIGLLIGIKAISKSYFNKPVVLEESNILNPLRLKVFTFLGLVCLCIPLSILGIWIYTFKSIYNQMHRVEIFNSYLPDFLHGPNAMSYLSLAFCLLTFIFSSLGMKLPSKLWTTLNIMILLFASLLFLMNLFYML